MPSFEQEIEQRFPLAGMDQSDAFCTQKPKEMPVGEYGRTCVSGVNVRSFDRSGRMRGGSRPGLVKYVDQAVGDIPDWIVQHMNVIVTVQ